MNECPAVQLLPASEARRERWRNGRGWTREIHAEAAPGGTGWQWRLSIADLDQPAAFSQFEGVERELMLLSGDGLMLCFDDGEAVSLQPPHGRLRFSGERALQGEPGGPGTSALNLMWRRELIEAAAWHRPLVGTMLVFVDPGDCWVVHVISGRACLARSTLPPLDQGDTLVFRAMEGRIRHVLDGGGELLLARFRSTARTTSWMRLDSPPPA